MIAIVIPVYKSATALSPNEILSIFQTTKVFNSYDIFLLTYKEIDTELYNSFTFGNKSLKAILFDKSFFKGLHEYSGLLMLSEFYRTLKDYEYALICQLDVFVFSDKIGYYTKKKIDYIGAPWFEGFDQATSNSRIIGIGNGGFSLRKVSSFIKVLETINFYKTPLSCGLLALQSVLLNPISLLRIFKNEIFRKRRGYTSIVPGLFPFYEDIFWGSFVPTFFKWFKIAETEDAISFSFEVNPRLLYEMNSEKLPMAVHAWEKYDPDFWRPFIEKESYALKNSS